MATYFERMRSGMQAAQQLLLEPAPGAQFEWGPMDNAANYPFYLLQNGRKLLLCKFSKDSLVAMGDDPHRLKAREALRQALQAPGQIVR